ncbi:MAG: EAL domain-containing protein [Shewanella sp.]
MSDFYLVYQPKVKDGKIIALEALSRPNDKSQHIEEYLADITDTVEFDLTVIKKCLVDVANYGVEIPVAVNIYPTSMLDPDFISSTIKLIKDKNIIIELMEHQQVDFTDCFMNNRALFKENGIAISIDDFGKDFARADLALMLDAEEIKIDRSLIDGIESNYSKYNHLAFVHAKLSALVTKNIIFEGVETKRQCELIQLITESPIIQGYYFYKPMFLADIVKLDTFANQFKKAEQIVNGPKVNDLAYNLFNFLAKDDSRSIVSEETNEFIKANDRLGLVYNADKNETLKNLRKIYFNQSSIINNGVMSLFDSTERLMVIRNQEGTVIYDNAAHRSVVGGSIIGIDAKKVAEENESYKVCLVKDQKLRNNEKIMFSKNSEIFDGKEYDTLREKMFFNNNHFVITTVREANSGLLDVQNDELNDVNYLNTIAAIDDVKKL